jgi:hypothetical protein
MVWSFVVVKGEWVAAPDFEIQGRQRKAKIVPIFSILAKFPASPLAGIASRLN